MSEINIAVSEEIVNDAIRDGIKNAVSDWLEGCLGHDDDMSENVRGAICPAIIELMETKEIKQQLGNALIREIRDTYILEDDGIMNAIKDTIPKLIEAGIAGEQHV